MAVSTVRCCFLATTGELQMIIHADNSAELNDPAFNHPEWANIDIPVKTYNSTSDTVEVLRIAHPLIAQVRPDVAAKLQTVIDQIDAKKQQALALEAASIAIEAEAEAQLTTEQTEVSVSK